MVKRYNGTAWNAVTYCKNFNGTEQFTYFPVVANTFANAISSWTIKGNEQHTGTPAPGNPIRGVGEETANLFDYQTMSSGGNGYLKSDGTVVSSTTWNYTDYIPCNGTNFVLSKVGGGSAAICFYDNSKTYIYGQAYQTGGASTLADIICTVPQTAKYIRFTYANSSQGSSAIDLSTIMLSENTAAIPFEPYGYKIPISSGNATTPVYISAPLRKSLDGTVFDTLDSTGLVTYNVDEYGAPLVTPTTATVTVPTITSALGRTVISFGTTIQPSEFDMTYHGWHSHIPSIRSNNAWS